MYLTEQHYYSFSTQGLADSQACMHAVYARTATLDFLHSPPYTHIPCPMIKSLNLALTGAWGEMLGVATNTQHPPPQNLHSMHIPDSDHIRKLLPDGDELSTE